MLLRFIVENIFSFKEPVEFNTFPSSKSHNHEQHKVKCSHATALRLAAIYGANGAGKSNLLNALKILRSSVRRGVINVDSFGDNLSFRFDSAYAKEPSGMAIEFYQKSKIFYYHLEFNHQEIVREELLVSKKTSDDYVFRRTVGKPIDINKDFLKKGLSEDFIDVLGRLIRPEMLVLSFFGQFYPKELDAVNDAYSWFTDRLRVVLPDSISGHIPHLLDIVQPFNELVNELLPELKLGIFALEVQKEPITEESAKGDALLSFAIRRAQRKPGEPQVVENAELSNVVMEEGQLWLKKLVSIHKDINGNTYRVPVSSESDGARRLIEYMPLFYSVTKQDGIYIVDEIERSIHPIMIKTIMKKISDLERMSGQLIFTTHESGLLDQDIFRPDEIWFAQKDIDESTKLYPLSDFNIHKTANIENGYLSGRYGGIPFLSNLKDLHW